MAKKVSLLALVLTLMFVSSSFAVPNPPSKGQWAYPLEEYLPLYRKADGNSRSEEIKMPMKWISVPSATRDSDNYLWYKISVNGKTGWLPQNGIRLKMGGKSKSASNIYKNYAKARRKIMANPRGWSSATDDGITTYITEGAEFMVRKTKNGVEDLYFTTNRFEICREMLGVDLIDMTQPEVRSKLGTPTLRETPYDDPDMSVLSFELADRNMTLVIAERRENGDSEGTVMSVELYRGTRNNPDY